MSSNLSQIPKHTSHPDVPRPSDDDLVELARGVCHAIEACGASPELTHAVTLASDLMAYLQKPRLEPSCATSLTGEAHNPVHMAVDLSHAIGRLAETACHLRSDELAQVNSLIASMATKATELLRAGQA